MTRTPAAIIVGGGIAGLSAGIALRQAGYGVTICERAAAIQPVGAALSLWPNAIDALRRLGAAERIEAEAAPIVSMLAATRDGRPIIGPRRVSDRPQPGARAYLPTRGLLQTALAEVLGEGCLRLDHAVAAVSQDGGGVTVALDDGRAIRADLAIVADGIWSPTATALLGNAPRPSGYGGVLALSDPVDDPATEQIAAEYWGDGERFGLFDLGGRRRYWFYMRDDAADMPTPVSIVARAQDWAARAQGWPPGIASAIAATPADRLLPFAINARAASTRLGKGRILCVGDAAHAMEPNLGQGGCQALEDAVALGAVAARLPPEAMLPAFEALRLKRVRGFMRRSAEGRLGAHATPLVRTAVRFALRSLPNAVHDRIIADMHRLPDYR